MANPETSRTRDRKNRQKLRDKLRAEGASEALIEKILERRRFEDLAARQGLDRAREIRYDDAHRHDPDDTGYQPKTPDPLLNGPGRPGGLAAKVVRRRDTITRFQYDARRSSESK